MAKSKTTRKTPPTKSPYPKGFKPSGDAKFDEERLKALAKDEHDRQFTEAVDYVQGLLRK